MRGFGELEAVIMQLVWDHGNPVTVRELFDELRQERAIAYTTVMSTMDNLHRKGWLDRVKEGKAYRYAATASREEYSARLMREALADGGNTEAVLSHFVADMDGDESELLRAVVRRLGQTGPARTDGARADAAWAGGAPADGAQAGGAQADGARADGELGGSEAAS
jgi:predicted transcriptional regulator